MTSVRAPRAGDPTQVGRYRVIGRLGAGGMGEVFLGRSPTGLNVAVKRMHHTLADDQEFRRRFAREAAAAGRVSGAFTASVIDMDADAELPWLATVYVAGMSLQESVQEQGAMPATAVAALGARLAEALEAIHRAGVIHRDLKPSNVLLAPDGPRVIDFGIAVTGDGARLTRTGAVLGSMGYMAPEQLLGQPAREAGDVFALGAVLAFTANAANPFGQTMEEAVYRTVHEPPALGGTTGPLRDLLLRCLAKDPAERPEVPGLLGELVELSGPGQGSESEAGIGWLPRQHAESVRARARESGVPTSPVASDRAPSFAPPPTWISLPPDTPSTPTTSSTPTTPGTPPTPTGAGRRAFLVGLAVAGAGAAGFGIHRFVDGDGTTAGKAKKPLVSAEPEKRIPPGTELWSFYTGDGVESSPAVVDGTVFVGSLNGRMFALDAATGRTKWSFRTDGPVRSAPVVGDGVVVFSSDDKNMYGLDAGTGKLRWKFAGGLHASPALAGGVVYFSGEHGIGYALDVRTGVQKWMADGIMTSSVDTAPAVSGDRIYFGCTDTRVYALDTGGKALWDFATEEAVFSRPTVRDGVLYVGSDDFNLYAVDAASGKEKWVSAADAQISGGLAVTADSVYFGSLDNHLYGVFSATGEHKWKFPAGDQIQSTPAFADGVVYIGSVDKKLHAVDAATGKERWSFTCGDWVMSSPTVFGGAVYFGSDDRKLRAVKT